MPNMKINTHKNEYRYKYKTYHTSMKPFALTGNMEIYE